MTTTQLQVSNATEVMELLGNNISERAAQSDKDGVFVSENYAEMKALGLFGALIPTELGGLGWSYSQVTELVKELGKRCGSTALAFSMHQHLVSAAVWKYLHKGEGEPTLRKIAANQLVLVSTGARDWLGSNGEMTKVDGGYLLTATKHFASQSIEGDIAITSAGYRDENGHDKVLHFSAPLSAEGVRIHENWDTLGMRATGSHAIVFDEVFIPESAIALTRDKDEFHPIWNVVLTVAMPLIMSAYVGIAERSVELAFDAARKNRSRMPHLNYSIGQLNNRIVAARAQWKAMVMLTNDLDFTLAKDNAVDILSFKTNVAEACKETVSLAMSSQGGQGFYRAHEMERLFRDVQASAYHPLPEWSQYAFCSDRLLSVN